MATSWGTASEADPCPLHERTYTPYKKVYQQAEACTLGTAQPCPLAVCSTNYSASKNVIIRKEICICVHLCICQFLRQSYLAWASLELSIFHPLPP